MSESFYVRDDKEFPVKNLGWLLRHWKEVKSFQFNYFNYSGKTHDGVLVAYGKDFTYFTDFASLSVCCNFLNRPIFKTLKFSLVVLNMGKPDLEKSFEIGNNEWKEINKLEYPFFLNRTTNKPIELISSCCGVESVKPMPGTILGECSKCKNLFNFHVKGLSEQKTFENLPLIS